jgi:hypothetical protein
MSGGSDHPPSEGALLVREGARRTVRVEDRKAHGLACSLFDGARALEVIEVRRREPGHAALSLIPVDSSSNAKASVIALRAVFEGL